MKELVKGQKIRIDNHRRGTSGVSYYDDPSNDIHLDKTIYDGKKKNGEYRIRIPLNSNRPVTINRSENERIPTRLFKEIQEAFEDVEKRQIFLEEMRCVLNGYPIRDKNYLEVDKVKEAMIRISNAFDLDWNEGHIYSFIHPTRTQGLSYISLLPRNERVYYIRINYKEIIVSDFSIIPPMYVKEWIEI